MCKRRGRKPHFGWKKGVSFTLWKKMHENSIFSPITGWGRTPGTPYAGPATAFPPYLLSSLAPCWHMITLRICDLFFDWLIDWLIDNDLQRDIRNSPNCCSFLSMQSLCLAKSMHVQVTFSRFYWNSKWPPRTNFNFFVGVKTQKNILVNSF